MSITSIRKGRIVKPPRMIVYGTNKIGKSTFAASACSPIFVPTEEGVNQLDVHSFPLCKSAEDVRSCIRTLLNEDHEYQTCVIDSADWFERLIHREICKKFNVASIELAAGGYGKGYTFAATLWGDFLEMLDELRDKKHMAIILIAHERIERYNDPTAPAYDRFVPDLHKSLGPVTAEWADVIAFAHRKIRVSVDEHSKTERMLVSGIGKDGGERVLQCFDAPSAKAGNRYKITEEIALDWNAFQAKLSQFFES